MKATPLHNIDGAKAAQPLTNYGSRGYGELFLAYLFPSFFPFIIKLIGHLLYLFIGIYYNSHYFMQIYDYVYAFH